MVTRQLPDWAGSPTIMSFNSIQGSTVMSLMLTGARPASELKTIVDETVTPLLERIEGVANVDTLGGSELEYDIVVSQERLAAYSLTLNQISSALSSHNIQSSSGEILQDELHYDLTIDGRYRTLEEIENTVITVKNGIPILISDVVDVVITQRLNFLCVKSEQN